MRVASLALAAAFAGMAAAFAGMGAAMAAANGSFQYFGRALPCPSLRRAGRRTPVAVDRRRAAKRRNQARNRRAQR